MTPVSAAQFLGLLGLKATAWQIRALEAWADDRKKTVIIFGATGGNYGEVIEDLQKSPRWDHDTFPLSIQKEDTFVSHPKNPAFMERGYIDQFRSSYFGFRNFVPMSEIQRRSDDYWAATNAPRLWRWQGNRPVRKLFQSRPVRTVIPGMALTRRPAGRYYSGTRKAMNRKLAA